MDPERDPDNPDDLLPNRCVRCEEPMDDDDEDQFCADCELALLEEEEGDDDAAV